MNPTSLGTPLQDFSVEETGSMPFRIASLECSLELALEILGPPHLQERVDGLGDGDHWAFEYPCGIQLRYLFIHPLANGIELIPGIVYADLPDIQHGMRHLPFPSSCKTAAPLDVDHWKITRISQSDPRNEQLHNLHRYQVWRQGDDGNEMPVGSPTTERDAKCWVKELESHGHKQMYWHGPVFG